MNGLTVALGELLNMAPDSIENHARSLSRLLSGELDGTGWKPFRAITDKAASAHIITLENSQADIDETLNTIRAANIICGTRNGRIRVSLAHFNNSDDVRALAKILQ